MLHLASVANWLSNDRKGHTLPRGLYVSDEAFAFDTQVMLKSVWLYTCTVAHVKNAGDYFVFDLAADLCGHGSVG